MRLAVCAVLAAWCAAPTPARAERIELRSGDVLFGRVVIQTDASVLIEHPVMGELRLPADQVAHISDDSAGANDVQVVDAKRASSADANALDDGDEESNLNAKANRKLLKDWKLQASLGFSGSQGNTENVSIHAGFKASHASPTDRWRIDSSYFYSSRDNDRTQNEFELGVQKDWLLPDSPWFFFLETRYEYDEFRPWDHRVSIHGGMGYDMEPVVGLNLTARLGAGVTKEFGGVSPDTHPESLVGGEMQWQITPRQSLSAKTTFFPNIDDTGEYRVVTTADWSIKIDQAAGLSLKLGLKNEYESMVPPGFEHNDLKYFGALVFDF